MVAEAVGELRSRGGDDLWACCPFHHEDTPSFHIRPALGVFKCFGCGESGDVISFVMKTRGLGFREALELLAERAGIELGSLSPEDRRRQAEARRSRQVLDVALSLFRRALGAAPTNPGLQYMLGRGFTPEVLQRFDIGFIPPDFLRSLRGAVAESGPVEGAGFTLAFGGRVGFGIRDGNGALVGFGARRLDDAAGGPKYVNTRETAWFAKGRLLYGLDKASRRLARTRRLVVMEGYTDVMMAHQAGLDEAVATMGTSFTAEHLRLVKARVGNLVLVFDGDEPGCQAAERAARMVLAKAWSAACCCCRRRWIPATGSPPARRADFDALLGHDGPGAAWPSCAGARWGGSYAGQPGGREAVAREMLELSATIRTRCAARRSWATSRAPAASTATSCAAAGRRRSRSAWRRRSPACARRWPTGPRRGAARGGGRSTRCCAASTWRSRGWRSIRAAWRRSTNWSGRKR